MANPADSYDPTMLLATAKNMGQPDATNTAPADHAVSFPEGMQRNDPTANTGTVGEDRMPLQTQASGAENTPRWPVNVDNFDPLNLPIPPRVKPGPNPDRGAPGQP